MQSCLILYNRPEQLEIRSPLNTFLSKYNRFMINYEGSILARPSPVPFIFPIIKFEAIIVIVRPNSYAKFLLDCFIQFKEFVTIQRICYNSKNLLQFKEFVTIQRICYNSKNLNCIGALSFLKICSHIFMIFEVKLEYWFWSRQTRSEKAI